VYEYFYTGIITVTYISVCIYINATQLAIKMTV